ncbi:hypothetical protein C2G38_2058673 [Gigaspora rosea]|uniref:Protein kinase domain-containing protein n=1 Tax=Gigaspora rosea TaxID=44941 RepID=A0A397WAJ9_9GLOM|nr:hypothetical protein C2G38_2058673 [Gigaspora rosea]
MSEQQPKGETQEKYFDYSEFNILEQIGEGAYGKIFKAILNNQVVALKLLKPGLDENHITKEVHNQRNVIKLLKH